MNFLTDGTLLQFIVPIATLIGGLVMGRKKAKVDIEKAEGNALSIMQDTYTQLVLDMKNRYTQLQGEIEELKAVNSDLNKSIDRLIKEIAVLKKQ